MPIILHPLGSSPSIHICIYLPTEGKDKQFVEELTALSSTLHDISFSHTGTPVYLRGDFNVSNNNKKRRALLDRFMESEGLTETIICHPTYHHFMGSGSGDSHLDKVLYSSNAPIETIHTIVCRNENPLVESHHDIILSESDHPSPLSSIPRIYAPTVPQVPNERYSVVWSKEGIADYQNLVVPQLQRLQDSWLEYSSISCTELLIQSTN